jgi:hypothetical protein
MHRTIILLAVSLLVIPPASLSQTEDRYEPVPPGKSSPGRIGGALGYTPGWLFMDLDELNRTIVAAGGTPFDGGRLLMHGGQGYAYILLVKNLRVGGTGMTGTRSTSRLETATGTRRDVELHVGYGGVTLEYTVPIVPRLDVTFGAVFGGGGMDITIRRDQGSARDWGGVWGEIGGPADAAEYTRKLEGSFFAYQPSVSLEFAILRWLGVRAGAGYLGLAGGSWQLDGAYELLGVPDGISAKGWMINTGIYLGTFIY